MKSGIMYSQGEILLIPVPFSDLTTSKQRPVLVLPSYEYNIKTDDIVVAAITSNISNKEFEVVIKSSDLEIGALKVLSCVRSDKIYTLSQKIIIKQFGKVSSEIIQLVKEKISHLLTEKSP